MTDSDIIRSREDLLAFFSGLDAKRPNAWAQYGYKEALTFEDFQLAYDRGGAGFGAVHRLLDGCWQKLPRIKQPAVDKPTPWETKTLKVLKAINGWQKLRDLDRRNMVGRYSALIYRMADNQLLSQPLATATKLVDLVPVFENQIKVTKWDEDKTSERYGQPLTFQYRARKVGGTDTQGQPDEWQDVHHTRVQILAEGSVGDMFEGVPLLKAGFNSLVDLEKISGGSAESFLKNSARTVVFEYDPQATPQAIPGENGAPAQTVREAHESQTRRLNRNQDASIVMQGGKASTLQTTISDPAGPGTFAANLFAASVRIPFTILFGQQTGRLASDEDKADFGARCASRQANDLTPMLEEFVRRMQAAGVIDQGDFEIEWPPVNAPSDADKLANLNKATTAAQQAFQAGLTEPLFDANELRAMAGFEPRADDGMPAEGDLDEPNVVPTTGKPVAGPNSKPGKPQAQL
jgi:hypothetical protein